MVNPKIKHSVIYFKPINHRLCILRDRGRFNNLSLICSHAPTEEKNEYIKDSFHEELETTVTGCPKNDIKILLGDFNAKEGFEDQGRSVAGNCGLHEKSNDNGLRLIGLTSVLNMVIRSTTFPHKKIHLATWRSEDCTTNQIDHILIDA
jgi:hypothetical protein